MGWMRSILTAGIFLLADTGLRAQNLVPNGGFEDYDQCPRFLGAFDEVRHWTQPIPYPYISADFFHHCAPSSVNVPETDWGYQYARTGKGMAGIIAWQGYASGQEDYRESIQVALSSPLVAGQRYCVSFYVSPTIGLFPDNQYVAIDEIGIHLSKDRFQRPSGYSISLPYSIQSPKGRFLDDTLNWMEVRGIYQAQGGERWLTLGCFDQGSGPPGFKPLFPASLDLSRNLKAYLFIDDVSVVPMDPRDTLFVHHFLSLCSRDTADRWLVSTGNEGVFQWSTGENQREVRALKPGKYRCVSQAFCQVVVDEFELAFDPRLLLDLGYETGNCDSMPIQIQAPTGFAHHRWSTGDTGTAVWVEESGLIYLEAENECGWQKDSLRVYIESRPPPPLTSDTFLCQGVKDPVFRVEGENLSWYSSSRSLIGAPFMPYIHTDEPGMDSVFVTQRRGYCESEKAAIYIKVLYKPKEEIPDEVTLCGKDPGLLGSPAQPGTHYAWNTGSREAMIIPTREGHYTRTSSNECGEYADNVRLYFSDCRECLMLPNAFMPSRGGMESFRPEYLCPVMDYEMKIFNRWGNLIFESSDPQEGWDGLHHGQPAGGGAYVYMIRYRSTVTGDPWQISGTVYLIR